MIRFKTLHAGFLKKINAYLKKIEEVRLYLKQNPDKWWKLQPEFNREVNGLFEDILLFELQNKSSGEDHKTDKLKNIFVKKYRDRFLMGEYVKWVYDKPYGYAGDFWIIDALYRNNPVTQGVERLFDNYYLQSPVAQAVRNRKDNFKREIKAKIQELKKFKKHITILNVASGPCREIAEMLVEEPELMSGVSFNCLDQEVRAHEYAKTLIGDNKNITFLKKNAMRLSDQTSGVAKSYDIIYSMGLFDYLNHESGVKLIMNLNKILGKNGMMLVANITDKSSNSSVYFMDWVADWSLIYRTEQEFEKIFLDAGFGIESLTSGCENEGLFQQMKVIKE